jgi:anti-sigma regulatory factor (Ser/Thr protein kinase)
VSSLFAGAEPLEQTRMLDVVDLSQVGEARRSVAALTAQLQLDESEAGRAALVTTELATNVARHGRGGRLLVRAVRDRTGIEIVAIDKGPGMADLSRALHDGFSTSGTSGTGLGAVQRMSDVFDVYTQPGRGTAVLSRLYRPRGALPSAATSLEIGIMNVPAPGERLCGDGYLRLRGVSGPALLVVDGLGHGASAHRAAVATVDEARRRQPLPLAELLPAIHAALHGTRGAAVAVAELDEAAATLKFAGVGNISCTVADGSGTRSLASMNGTAGAEMGRVHEFTAPFSADATLVLFSDGVQTRWRLDDYPGLRPHHPALIAAVILRDHLRGRDDATILIGRRRRAT